MADKVRQNIEQEIQKLAYLEEKNVFNEEEIRTIIKNREQHEYRMIKNSAGKIDFLNSIQYEMELENQRRTKMKELKYHECHLDFQIVKRIIFLFDRVLKRHRYDYELIREYLKFCLQIKSTKILYNAFLKNLKYYSHSLEYWMILILYEFQVRRNIFKAREIFQKALDINKNRFDFWEQYLYFELEFLKLIQQRENFVDQMINQENKIDHLEQGSEEKEEEIAFSEGMEELEFKVGEGDIAWIEYILKQIEELMNDWSIKEKLKYENKIWSLIKNLENHQSENLDDILESFRGKAESVFGKKFLKSNIDEYNNDELFTWICYGDEVSLKNLEKLNCKEISSDIWEKNKSQFIKKLQSYSIQDLTNIQWIEDLSFQNLDLPFFQEILFKKYQSDSWEVLSKLISDSKNRFSKQTQKQIEGQFFNLFLEQTIQPKISQLLSKDLEKIFKLTKMEKIMLKILAQFIFQNKDQLSMNQKQFLSKKFMDLRNYCPDEGITLVMEFQDKETENFYLNLIEMKKQNLEIWKKYLDYLVKYAKYDKFRLLLKKSEIDLSEENHQQFQEYYESTVNQINN